MTPSVTLEDGTMVQAQYACSIDEENLEPPFEKMLIKATPEQKERIGKVLAAGYHSVASAIIDSREFLSLSIWPLILKMQCGDKFLSWLAYGFEHPSRGKRKDPMDVQDMVQKWVPLVKQLALAHDIDEKDLASAALDDLLREIITAPVKQLREFYRELTAELKKDKSVPWALWKLFDFWGENVLDKLQTEQEMVLRGELAQQIAERSIEQIPVKDWIDSMIGALMWRSPERLEEIKAKLDEGHKPRVKGRESCLFLQVDEAEVML